jgi:putative transposase
VVAPTRLSLPDIVHRFKSFTTAQYRSGVEQSNWQPFPEKFWQRTYYEHIIRDESELRAIREYIRYNPLKWHDDEENPNAKKTI